MYYSTASLLALAATASAQWTSVYNITATPNQVVNASSLPAPGQPGASGQFNYAINSASDTICYNITLYGVSGAYRSPALTATHIHEAATGRNGPPRIAFPNPVAIPNDPTVRRSVGCATYPFRTGIFMADNVTDTGASFRLSQIEANPAGFFTDSHTELFVPGVVRGQLNMGFTLVQQGLGQGGNAVPTVVVPYPTGAVSSVLPTGTGSVGGGRAPVFTGAACGNVVGGSAVVVAAAVAAAAALF